MAPNAGQARDRRRRPPGLLLAELALVVVLLAALGLFWPAKASTNPPRDVSIVSQSVAQPRSATGQAEDDLAPPRNLPWRVPIQANPMPPLPPASARPVQLFISSLNLHPLVESVGVDRTGAMSAPRNYFDVGWYNLGPVPGDPGDAVIDGHAGYPDQSLVFGRLSKIRSGDRITVVLADGTRRLFTVKSVKGWPWRAHPTGLFQGDGPARLTLITCSGTFNDQTHAYSDRLVVEANYSGPG
jgi:sortase A